MNSVSGTDLTGERLRLGIEGVAARSRGLDSRRLTWVLPVRLTICDPFRSVGSPGRGHSRRRGRDLRSLPVPAPERPALVQAYDSARE